jgi:hypothetical protein
MRVLTGIANEGHNNEEERLVRQPSKMTNDLTKSVQPITFGGVIKLRAIAKLEKFFTDYENELIN